MDETSPLLGNRISRQTSVGPDLLSPNLRPRHQELIPTPCGPMKPWSELSCLLKLYFCFTIASLVALLSFTIYSIYKQHMDTDVYDEDNFTVSLILFVGIVFCIYYISRGVLQENRQELVAFVLSMVGVVVRSLVNFTVLESKSKKELLVGRPLQEPLRQHTARGVVRGRMNSNNLNDVTCDFIQYLPAKLHQLPSASDVFVFRVVGVCYDDDDFSKHYTCKHQHARFVCIMTLGVIHILCTTLLIMRPNMMAFRVGGALESLQEQYFLLNLCFSMVTFDLQAQLCLCILITTADRAMSVANSIILAVGIVWACLTSAVGAIAVLKEKKICVWVFMVLNLPEVAFFVYVMYWVVMKWHKDGTYTLEAAAVTGALISLVIKVVLFWGLIKLVHSFGQGLRERILVFQTLHRAEDKTASRGVLTNQYLYRVPKVLNYSLLVLSRSHS
ncbi:hypothetical protein D9C73_011320 [Collichthys lucidus]|uniref:DUF7789 domain-containing protein n=1 Tax=Collichthys lucidus TaxID=240159 RepID=A0A4U5UQW2_COLLU|nr:hypothetical protein D9C73_011320 [Collichthys lucidus]